MFNLLNLNSTLPRRFARLVAVLLLAALPFMALQSQSPCACSDCPLAMPDGFTGNFAVQIQNASNPVLGQNGQGICGVRLQFDHEYLGDLQISLTSPSGQTVTLVGPTGFFDFTNFTTWNVLFLPCGTPPSPDPGFAGQWSNNQNWGLFGNYSGSYHPASGCFEDFNGGTVNGQWTLSVSDLQSTHGGNLLGFEIIFCDAVGVECVNCAANAGNLLQPDVSACAGDASLNLNLPPTFVPPNALPPTPEYTYTYLVGGSGGVLLSYQMQPDLTAFPPGNYTVCGMSYLTAQSSLLPPPNGVLTLVELAIQLNSNQPPFCGKITSNCVNVTISQQQGTPAVPVVQGVGNVCEGATHTYTVAPVAGASFYVWQTTGGTIVSGQHTETVVVEWGDVPISYVCAMASNGCDTSLQNCLTVTVNELPVANAGADDAECDSTAFLQAIKSVSGSVGSWALVSGPGTVVFSSPDSAATSVTASQPGQYLFRWTETNGICADSSDVLIDFRETPIAGPIEIACDGLGEFYTVSFPILGGVAPYIVLGAGTISGSNFVSDPIPSGQSYSFYIEDANGCVSPLLNDSVDCACISFAGAMNPAPITVCEGDSAIVEHLGGETLDPNDVWSFVLHENSGPSLGGVVAQNTTGVFVFEDGMIYGKNYYASFVVGNGLGGLPDPDDPCLSVAAGQPVVFFQNPVSNAGDDRDTCGLVLQMFAEDVNGTSVWSVSSAPPGATVLFSNPNDSVAVVTVSAFGTYVLTWTSDVDGCLGTDEVTLQFNDSPVLTDLLRTCDNVNENYSITLFMEGGNQPYSVNGELTTGGTYTSALFANGQAYSFEVVDANGCAMPLVTGVYGCTCSTHAGSMRPDTLTACEGELVQAAPNLLLPTLDANDVTGYVLHNGTGTALGQIFAQNTSGLFGFQNGMNLGQTYYISLVVGNNLNGFPNPADPCFSVAKGQPVVFWKKPIPALAADAVVCDSTLALQGISDGFPGTWSQVSGPAIAVFSSPNSISTTVYVTVWGTYTFEWTETNGACVGADGLMVTFNESPSVSNLTEICNGTNTAYSIGFSVSGGIAPYLVTGLNGAFVGNDFNSVPLPNNAPYTFSVVDANGCASHSLSGMNFCECTTDAGTMQTSPALFCPPAPATAVWNNDATFDADDMVQFILHDQPGASVGNVLAVSTQPVFDFSSNLQPGITYYISAIAGNNVSGTVELTDPCLSVSPGTPIQWKPLPTVTLSGDAAVCSGDSVGLLLSGTGAFPLQVTYSDGITQNTLLISSTQPATLQVAPTIATTYTLIEVVDGTVPTCSAALSQSATVSVSQPVSAGTAHAAVELCEGAALPLQLVNFLTDADFGGQWTETSAVPSSPGAFNAQTGTFETGGQAAGTYTFRYTLSAQPPCPNDEETVTIRLLPQPVADAGNDRALNCDQAAVLLGGPNTSTGAGIQYHWLLNGDTVGTTAQIFASFAGEYILSVSNSADCFAADTVTLVLDIDPPRVEAISVTNIRCYGDRDGQISIDSAFTNFPPLLYALNNGMFSPNPVFKNLEAGTYTVTLMDANGCEFTTQVLTISEPPELKIELGDEIEAALGDSVYLTASLTVSLTGLDTIVWGPLLDSAAAGKEYQHFLPLQSLQVSATVTDTTGCVASDKVLIRVTKERRVYVPNVFKPTSAENGIFQVLGGTDVAEVEVFKIYDRWGEQVYEALDFQPGTPGVGWIGRHRGKDVLPGVYVWYALVRFIDGQQEIFSGDVTVFR
ncbi:MAG: proprotein convertase P-domain-containing protein [Saprospiraceae bacterium]|nr:proprotein convertase P-domain-containing protein [Saprospiraceae bacterium]